MAVVLSRIDEDWRYEEKKETDVKWLIPQETKNTMNYNVVQFKIEPNARPPKKTHPDDAGTDLAITESVTIGPWEQTVIGTGIRVSIPKGKYGQIYPRSSLAKIGLCTEGGVIDATYRGIIKLILSNRNPRDPIILYKGEYIAQMVIHKIDDEKFEEVQKLDETVRGEEGFGSTNKMEANAVILRKEITENKHEQQATNKHGYKLGQQLTLHQTEEVRKLMHKYEDILATTFEEIRVHDPIFKHDIKTGDHKPIKRRPYRVPPALREWQRKENKHLEDTGVTRSSNSP